MIYTVTFNPAIDYAVNIETVKVGVTNRSTAEDYSIGGKGINVSCVLAQLGIESVAMGFVAGFTGIEIINGLLRLGIKSDFVTVDKGISRINIKLKSDTETEINGQGPEISTEHLNKLIEKISVLQCGDTLVLAGSVSGNLPANTYETILSELKDKNIRIIADTTGDLLLNVLKYKPFLIKPNHYELGQLFNTQIECDDYDAIEKYSRILKSKGAENVLVSMADKGAVLLDSNGDFHIIDALKVDTVNSVGAGDSMIAGFIAGYEETKDFKHALKLGVACGSATASLQGLAEKTRIDEFFNKVINMPVKTFCCS